MEIAGEYRIAASKQTVWEGLNDPEILRASIPGCESIERHSDTSLSAVVKIKMGPVRATFRGKVTLSDLDPPNSYTISGEGEGGVAGFGRGSARVSLADAEGGTLLTYAADAVIGGKLAQIGSRLVDSATRKLSKDFFEKFAKEVEAAALATPSSPAPAEAPEPATAPAPAAPVTSPAPEEASDAAAGPAGAPKPAALSGTAELTAGLVAIALAVLVLLEVVL